MAGRRADKGARELSLAGEEVPQFLRADLSALLDGAGGQARATARWADLRIAATDYWRTGRDHGNDHLRDIVAAADVAVIREEMAETLRAARAQLGTKGNLFLDACRDDLQRAGPDANEPGVGAPGSSRVLEN